MSLTEGNEGNEGQDPVAAAAANPVLRMRVDWYFNGLPTKDWCARWLCVQIMPVELDPNKTVIEQVRIASFGMN